MPVCFPFKSLSRVETVFPPIVMNIDIRWRLRNGDFKHILNSDISNSMKRKCYGIFKFKY